MTPEEQHERAFIPGSGTGLHSDHAIIHLLAGPDVKCARAEHNVSLYEALKALSNRTCKDIVITLLLFVITCYIIKESKD